MICTGTHKVVEIRGPLALIRGLAVNRVRDDGRGVAEVAGAQPGLEGEGVGGCGRKDWGCERPRAELVGGREREGSATECGQAKPGRAGFHTTDGTSCQRSLAATPI